MNPDVDELLGYLPSVVERFLVRGVLVELELAALLRYHREVGLVDLVDVAASSPARGTAHPARSPWPRRPGRAR